MSSSSSPSSPPPSSLDTQIAESIDWSNATADDDKSIISDDIINTPSTPPPPSSGPSGAILYTDLSSENRASFELLCDRVKDIDTNRDRLLRFFIARNYDINKAEEMIRTHIQWRKENLPISYKEIYHELIKGKFYWRGKDKEGRPIMVIPARLSDPKNRIIKEVIRSIIYLLEKKLWELECERKAGLHKITQITILYDREGFGRSHLDMALTREIAATLAANYPECLFTILLHPAGIVFRSIWNIAQHFFDPKTRSKLHALKSLSKLQEWIDASQLLIEYGGTDEWRFNKDNLKKPEEVIGTDEEFAGNEEEEYEKKKNKEGGIIAAAAVAK